MKRLLCSFTIFLALAYSSAFANDLAAENRHAPDTYSLQLIDDETTAADEDDYIALSDNSEETGYEAG